MKNKLATLTIFLGSMLLFGVQPMVGRTLLPFFGGTSAVWIVCLCAFQILLLGGYFYADRLAGGRPSFTRIHLVLLVASAAWAYFVADHRALLGGVCNGLHPTLAVMLFLAAIVGLPYLALSANSSLVQALASRGGRDVYRLYSVSNVGSLIGLFLYPFVLEPLVSVGMQWRIFAFGLAAYAVLLSFLAKGAGAAETKVESAAAAASGATAGFGHQLLWITLPALSCAALNALTAHLTLNIVALPLLWCVLLALFLLTYILGFSGMAEKWLKGWDALALVSGGLLAASVALEGDIGFVLQLSGACGLLLFGGTALHMRLYALRPSSVWLTRYYLFSAIGGAVGGVLTGLVAPRVFKTVMEFPLAVTAVVVAVAALRDWRRPAKAAIWPLFAAVVLGVFAWQLSYRDTMMGDTVYKDRGFFGTVRVTTCPAKTSAFTGHYNQFWHGTTLHCGQFFAEGYPVKATLYHGPLGGGFAITSHPKYQQGKPMRVGIVGMGMGVSCAYARPGDTYRCWEISPEALNLATNGQYFTFASACAGRIETVEGDARLALEKERAEGAPKYDLLQIDAFSGDSPPYSLCTKEAFKLYFDMLAPGGYLSVNISNWHLDFLPLIKAHAIGFEAHTLAYTQKPGRADTESRWALMMKDAPPKGFRIPGDLQIINLSKVREWTAPTDEKGSLISLLGKVE